MDEKKKSDLFQKFLKNDKLIKIVMIVGICGVVLIYLSSYFTTPKNEKEESPEEAAVLSADEYEEKIQKNLARIVSAITGEESPEIMVTLETLNRYVYAYDEKNKLLESDENEGGEKKGSQTSRDSETNYIILKDADGSQYALKLTEIQPEIKGVVVVSKYADNILMKEKITNAVKAALNISSSKVCIVGAK